MRAPSALDITAAIGASSFLGFIEEARELWRVHGERLPLPLQVQSRFFLGLAATRVSRLKEAKHWFRANIEAAREDSSLQPYASQGAGFYLYFVGRFQRSAHFAQKALRTSIQHKDPYIHFLSMDLLGHSYVQMGRRPEGLRLMNAARKLALKAGNENFASAFEIASLVYEAEAGLRPHTILKELETALKDLKAKDSYTRNNLILEHARQLTLRGRWQGARDLLDRESSSIYAFANRRQEMVLQLRLGEIAVRQGDFFAADHFVQAGKRCLHRIADRGFEVRLLGLEIKIKKLRGENPPHALLQRWMKLSEDHSTMMNKQILFRENLGPDPRLSEAEDPLGHLFRLAKRNAPLGAKSALDLGYLGLWPEFKGLKPGTSHFILLKDLRSFVLVTPQGVWHQRSALSAHQLKILQCLQEGWAQKEQLVQMVWGYEYDPLRHDAMVYSAMAKLRKILSYAVDGIDTTETGWSLSPDVHWELPPLKSKAPSAPVQTLPDNVELLSSRQIQALQQIRSLGLWTIRDYKTQYGVSTMTAFRDLDGLRKLKYLIRIGSGRSTKYCLPREI